MYTDLKYKYDMIYIKRIGWNSELLVGLQNVRPSDTNIYKQSTNRYEFSIDRQLDKCYEDFKKLS